MEMRHVMQVVGDVTDDVTVSSVTSCVGTTCSSSVDVDYCATVRPCHNSGTCINTSSQSYICICPPGLWTLIIGSTCFFTLVLVHKFYNHLHSV